MRSAALVSGAILTSLWFAVFVFGASLAPRSPTDFNYVVAIGDRFIAPPFPAFVTGEFPLGSDSFGRDTLSRLLWAVQPTLLLAFSIGALRVVIGALLGMAAGWSDGRIGRVLDAATSAAVSLPVLLVALLVVAGLQAQIGAAAFLLGLTITGWAEAAQFSADQTRIVRREKFIEAAHALGASDLQIARWHVWRQLVPVLRLIFILETSGALLSMASLGFLGYFVGGANWIMVTDFEAQRMAGAPELAEMLSSAVRSRDAAQIGIVGGTTGLIVLGLRLLGEGLQQRLTSEKRRRSAVVRTVTDFVQSQQDRLSESLSQRRIRIRVAIGIGVTLIVLATGATVRTMLDEPAPTPLAVTGGHVWASARRDAVGSRRASGDLSAGEMHIVWERTPGGGLGGVAVGRDGTMYVTDLDGKLHALDAEGRLRWSAVLYEPPVGAPGLNARGEIAVADVAGAVTTFDGTGVPLWRATIDAGRRAISGPVHDDDGNSYAALDGMLGSIDAQGDVRWRAQLPYVYFQPALRVGDGFIFFKDMAFSARSGAVLLKESRDDLDQFVTGVDGGVYLLSQSTLLAWRRDGENVSLARVAQLDWAKEFPGRIAVDAVVWFDGGIWLQIPTGMNSTRIVWIDETGEVSGDVALPYGNANVIAVDERGVQAICGASDRVRVRCDGLRPRAAAPMWSVEFAVEPIGGDRYDGAMVSGGALIGERLIVVTRTGKIVAIERERRGDDAEAAGE
jgi:peptide/nickel transport system permease protein